ncbi:thiol:disulfide interchange protein, DsbA family [Roseobacter sp. SK209-2-6]|uniref:DsbA family protein n=1 Tax=Roseobacter sp. SK209-2-6 TaxID=388739 RepID=UPI0000F3D185|nr:DsbA family protein [Roseobacter sp. SK209-2-6]EBA17178.1 thiol:disulfide interchange protein, DsbA family [Roseobacter sp. SK209-2-6]
MTRLMSGLCAAVALAAGTYALSSFNSQSRLPENPLIGAAHAQEAEVDTSSITEMVLGAEDAPVTLIEYASYTCPHCASFHNTVFKQLKEDYIDSGKVRFIYREVYFDRYGLWASMIARCGGPEKFFGVSDLIYKGQSEWARAGGATEIVDELRKIGRLSGLENETLEACLQDGAKAQTLVTWYQEHATKDGIQSTPSFILNGELIGNQSYESFKELLDAELNG